jgi:hypothetical protein
MAYHLETVDFPLPRLIPFPLLQYVCIYIYNIYIEYPPNGPPDV